MNRPYPYDSEHPTVKNTTDELDKLQHVINQTVKRLQYLEIKMRANGISLGKAPNYGTYGYQENEFPIA